MSIRALRSEHARAFSAWEATKSHKWAAEVSRLNREIMKRTRPTRTVARLNREIMARCRKAAA